MPPAAPEPAGTGATSRRVAAAALALACAGTGPRLAAQEAGRDSAAVPLPALEVRVTRAAADPGLEPLPLTTLDAGDLTGGRADVFLEESLRQVPGVDVQNRHNFAVGERVTVRGAGARAQFGVRGIAALVDDVPLTMPDGQTTLEVLDAADAVKLRVIRGLAASLYGNAAGGVLSWSTLDASPGRASAGAEALAGDWGLRRGRVDGSGAGGPIRWDGSASVFESDGWRDHARAEQRRARLAGALALGGAARLRLHLAALDMPFAENPGSLDAATADSAPRSARSFLVSQGAGKELTHAQLGGGADLRLDRATELRATLWGVARDVLNPIPGRIVDLDREAAGLRSELRGRIGSGQSSAVTWTAGADLQGQWDDRKESENLGAPAGGGPARAGEVLVAQRETVRAFGPFLRVDLEPLAGWRLSAGLRHDRYEFEVDDRLRADGDDSGTRTFAEWSPSAGLAWAAGRGIVVFARGGAGFATPTASELSNRAGGGGGLNPELRPEDLVSFDLGARGALGPDLTWDVALYVSEVEDGLVPFESPDGEVFFRNAGRISRDGAELALGWSPAGPWEVRGTWGWQRNRFDRFVAGEADFSGNREPGVPGMRAFLGVRHARQSGLRVAADLRWTDAFHVDDANRAGVRSWRVVDLRASWGRAIGGLRLRPRAGVRNLFDERYVGSVVPNAFGERYYEPAPGRSVYVGLSAELGGGG